MAVESISLYFLSVRKRKNLQCEGNGYLQKIYRSLKKLTSQTKKQTEVDTALYYPCALRGCHGKHFQSTVPTVHK